MQRLRSLRTAVTTLWRAFNLPTGTSGLVCQQVSLVHKKCERCRLNFLSPGERLLRCVGMQTTLPTAVRVGVRNSAGLAGCAGAQ